MSEDNRYISEDEADLIRRRWQGHGGTNGCYNRKCQFCGSWNTIEGTFGVECSSCDNYDEYDLRPKYED